MQVRNSLQKVYALFKQAEERGTASTLLTRHDEVGNISGFLAVDLEHDLKNSRVTLFYHISKKRSKDKCFTSLAAINTRAISIAWLSPIDNQI